MKKSIVFFLITLITISMYAQKLDVLPKNVIKVNLAALAFRNYSLQYERQLGAKSSIALNIHMLPEGKMPLVDEIQDRVGVSEIDFNKMRVGTFGIVPEYRFYLGKGAMKGFYVGPFAQYANYKMEVPITYKVITEKTGIFKGEVKTFTGGLQLGAQFNLGKRISLDWWIFGPNLGTGNGDLVYSGQLDPAEQQALRDQIENIDRDIPLDVIKSYEVNSNGATINAQGPVIGLRGFGINFGIRF